MANDPKLIAWIADKILANTPNPDALTAALRDNREKVIGQFHPIMFGTPEQYCFETSEVVIVNADPEDPDPFYTLAKNAVDHLRTSLLDGL